MGIALTVSAFLLFDSNPVAACSWIKPYTHPVHGMILLDKVHIGEIYKDRQGNHRHKVLKNYKGMMEGEHSPYRLDIMCGIGASDEGVYLFLGSIAERSFTNFKQAKTKSDKWWNTMIRQRTPLQFQSSAGPAPHKVKVIGPKKFINEFFANCKNGYMNKGGIDWDSAKTIPHVRIKETTKCENLLSYTYGNPGAHLVFSTFDTGLFSGHTKYDPDKAFEFYSGYAEVSVPTSFPVVKLNAIKRNATNNMAISDYGMNMIADISISTDRPVSMVVEALTQDGTEVLSKNSVGPTLYNGNWESCVHIPKKYQSNSTNRHYKKWKLKLRLEENGQTIASDEIEPKDYDFGQRQRCTSVPLAVRFGTGDASRRVTLTKDLYPTVSAAEVNWGDGKLQFFKCDNDCKKGNNPLELVHDYKKVGRYQINVTPHYSGAARGHSYMVDIQIK